MGVFISKLLLYGDHLSSCYFLHLFKILIALLYACIAHFPVILWSFLIRKEVAGGHFHITKVR
jgi:hypothetical protein